MIVYLQAFIIGWAILIIIDKLGTAIGSNRY